VFIFFPFIIFLLVKGNERVGATGIRRASLGYALAPFVGVGLSFLLMKWSTGNWFEAFDAQRAFIGNVSVWNVVNMVTWIRENLVQVDYRIHGMTNSILDRFVFLGFLFLLWKIWRDQDKPFFYYALFFGVISALGAGMMSFGRYLIVIFPIFVQLSRFRMNHFRVQLALFVLQVLLLAAHSLEIWVA